MVVNIHSKSIQHTVGVEKQTAKYKNHRPNAEDGSSLEIFNTVPSMMHRLVSFPGCLNGPGNEVTPSLDLFYRNVSLAAMRRQETGSE